MSVSDKINEYNQYGQAQAQGQLSVTGGIGNSLAGSLIGNTPYTVSNLNPWTASAPNVPQTIKVGEKYSRVTINTLKNGYEVDGYMFHTVLQLAHWLSQNLSPVTPVSSQEVA